jgi:hypothetical protein
VVINTTSFL